LKARLPKRGFNNKIHQIVYEPVNLKTLEALFDAGAEVTAATLQAKGVTVRRGGLVKVLAAGEITKKLSVKVHAVSAAAKEKIEKAGGTVAAGYESVADWQNQPANNQGVATRYGKRFALTVTIPRKEG
jgi:large subunit ribosomal protein L15